MSHGNETSAKTKSQVVEFARPGFNPFMEVLSSQLKTPKSSTPVQELHGQLRALERSAEHGDLRAWQEQRARLDASVTKAGLDEVRALEVKVQIKKIELTLLLKAGKRALEEARLAEKQATEAELTEDPTADQLKLKAQKLERMGAQLHQQLLAKVA